MRVILLNLPWVNNGRLGVRAGSRWPFTSLPDKDGSINYIPFPFFLAYATAFLKKKDNDAKLIDAIAQGISEEELIRMVNYHNPDLIVIETSTPSFKNDLRLTYNIRNNLRDCRIALCGPHVSVFPEQILSQYNFIDFILVGEYEFTLSELVSCLGSGLSLEKITGLAYRERGDIKVNSLRPSVDNLDSLPWPEREDVPIYKYNDGFAGLPTPNVQLWTSRGCPFQCIFCLWPQTIYRTHTYRKRNPVDVVDEMGYLVKRYNFRAVYFDDDVFNIDKRHVLDICVEINRRKLRVPWAAMAKADLMDEETLESLAKAGLYAVKYGVESADRNILNLCRKNLDLDKTLNVINFTKRLGIKVHLAFCIGLPGETRDSIERTSKFIRDIQPDSIQFSLATPFPGTEYYNYMKHRRRLVSEDWDDYDGNCRCIVRTDDLDNQELERIKVALDNNFNSKQQSIY